MKIQLNSRRNSNVKVEYIVMLSNPIIASMIWSEMRLPAKPSYPVKIANCSFLTEQRLRNRAQSAAQSFNDLRHSIPWFSANPGTGVSQDNQLIVFKFKIFKVFHLCNKFDELSSKFRSIQFPNSGLIVIFNISISSNMSSTYFYESQTTWIKSDLMRTIMDLLH